MASNDDDVLGKPVSLNHDQERRRRNKSPRWRIILDSAAEIFAVKGYESATVRDIADKANILAGSLYYYIREKQDILYALIEDFHHEGRAAIDAVLEEDIADPFERLRRVLEAHVRLNARQLTKTAVFYQDFRHLDLERRKDILADRRLQETRIASLIDEAQQAGLVTPDVDPKFAALSMLTLLNGAHAWYRRHPELAVEDFVAMQLNLLLFGLATHNRQERSEVLAAKNDDSAAKKRGTSRETARAKDTGNTKKSASMKSASGPMKRSAVKKATATSATRRKGRPSDGGKTTSED
ncbi:TetR family transcriptional regulator [Cumulibacter soli]|uniref:TetR family transcriptional regulator n=1 Tax=Cumulibacter soli TaxID=2546344 RepID=UPI001067B85D|nr:TetR family transcriptional regulator [Cumulibacter soli]